MVILLLQVIQNWKRGKQRINWKISEKGEIDCGVLYVKIYAR
jgi:hypothetical protein